MQLHADNTTSPARKLNKLMTNIVAILVAKQPLFDKAPVHEIPAWALYTGGACITMTVLAAAIGQWISSKSRGRYVVCGDRDQSRVLIPQPSGHSTSGTFAAAMSGSAGLQ